MNKYLQIIVILCILCSGGIAFALEQTPIRETQELVSMSESTHINDAVLILETFSLKFQQRKMINLSGYNSTIGIPINNLNWKTALELIAMKNNLVVAEQAGFISLNDPYAAKTSSGDASTETTGSSGVASGEPTGESSEPPLFDINENQVRIKSIVMLADKAYLKSLGIDWSTLLNGKVVVDVGFLGAQNVSGDALSAAITRTTTLGGQPIEINTLIRTIESNQKGTVIAQPNIVVSSGKRGYIQVGQDISVKTVDDAGNTTDKFFATGVILDVIPTVINTDEGPLVHLITSIERSSASPGAISTVINKNQSSTEIILYDGEETAIGGLYDTDEIRVRSGIPFLKDLPWWVLGIRYLTGYDKYERKERELIIILQVEVIESALDRMRKKGLN